MLLRQDVATGTLGRAAPGKFVETLAQILQFLERGAYEPKPNVDDYLKNIEARPIPSLDDGLRICAARVGRSMYSLRNKRNILHKGSVDPNTYDLRYLFAGAQWVMSELIRVITASSMKDAGALVEQVQAPVSALVERFPERDLLLRDIDADEEALILLHGRYPEVVGTAMLVSSMDRRGSSTVYNALSKLWAARAVERGKTPEGKKGYKLTLKGFGDAEVVIRRLQAEPPDATRAPRSVRA